MVLKVRTVVIDTRQNKPYKRKCLNGAMIKIRYLTYKEIFHLTSKAMAARYLLIRKGEIKLLLTRNFKFK